MTDTLTVIRDKIAKAEAKVERAEKSLETARSDLSDLQTALRVLEDIAGVQKPESGAPSQSEAMANRQMVILSLLREGSREGQAPADLYPNFKAICGGDISIETFRTSIWRMKDKVFGEQGRSVWVRGDNGVYWKEPGVDLHSTPNIDDLIGGKDTPKEKEPISEDAVGSHAGWGDGATSANPWKQPSDHTADW